MKQATVFTVHPGVYSQENGGREGSADLNLRTTGSSSPGLPWARQRLLVLGLELHSRDETKTRRPWGSSGVALGPAEEPQAGSPSGGAATPAQPAFGTDVRWPLRTQFMGPGRLHSIKGCQSQRAHLGPFPFRCGNSFQSTPGRCPSSPAHGPQCARGNTCFCSRAPMFLPHVG